MWALHITILTLGNLDDESEVFKFRNTFVFRKNGPSYLMMYSKVNYKLKK